MADEFDDLNASIRAAMESNDPVEPLPTEVLPADTADDAPIETAAEKADRVRDEQGRFAKQAEPVQDAASQVQEPEKTILPPRSWTAAAKADFASLPPHVQQEVLRREGEIDQGKAQWDTKAEQFNKLDAVLAPVKDRLTLSGLTPDTYVRALVQADEMLRGPQKLEAIHMLAQQYGINLGQPLAQGGPQIQPQGQQPYQGQPDPQYAALQQQLQDLRTWRDQQEQSRQAEAKAQVHSQIEQFASDPRHVYFDNVRADMAAMISAKPTLTLEEAYDRACNADPEIRQLLAAAAASKGKTLTQTKPAGVQVTGAQRGSAAKPNGASQTNSYEDDVRAAYQEVMGGGRV